MVWTLDPELVDDLEVDQRQDDGLGVVDGVRDRQQPERAHRVDLGDPDRGDVHRPMVPHRWPISLGQPAVARLRGLGVSGIVAGPSGAPQVVASSRAEGTHPMPTVLIVDDEQHIRLLIEQTLEELAGRGRRAATRPRTATRRWPSIAAQHPDLVFLDVMMPGRNGFEVCRAVTRRPGAGRSLHRAAHGQGPGARPRARAWRPAPTSTSPSRSTRTSCSRSRRVRSWGAR